MKANKTNEMLEQYVAPKCKVVKTMVNHAILTGSYGTQDYEKETGDWE